MATFTYTALTKDGKKETGTIQAASSAAAGHMLKEQGLTPTEVHEQKEHKGFAGITLTPQTVKLAEKIVFIEDLTVMLKSGIAVARALKIIAEQNKNKYFKKVLTDISRGVESGKSLHEIMATHPKVFSDIFVSMIKVGEMSGNLEQSLAYLAVQLEREADLKSHIRGAMIYPCVIISAMIIIGIVMAIFVLPKLTSVFKEFGAELPFMTRVVIAGTDFMAGNAVLVIGGLIALVVATIFAMRTPLGKRLFYIGLIHFPILNPVVKKINLARFARVFSSLMKSGIPIVEGIQVAAESIPNVLYREVLMASSDQIKSGKSFTSTLSQHETLFPVIVLQMLEVGEETGSMENILEQLAVHYEAEIDQTMKNFSSIIEPLLLLLIGGIVGVLALALIMPIYSIGTNIQ